jgi:hypothetical protein
MTLLSVFSVFTGAGLGALLRWFLGGRLNPLFPTVPPERQIINLPDIPIPFNQTGQVASDRIYQALGEPKISFGLVVTWIKGEKGQPNKETYEVSGSLKK